MKFILSILALITNFAMKNFFDKIHTEVATGLLFLEFKIVSGAM